MNPKKVIVISENKVEMYGDADSNYSHPYLLREYVREKVDKMKQLGRILNQLEGDYIDYKDPGSLSEILSYLTNEIIVLNIFDNFNNKYSGNSVVVLPTVVSDELGKNFINCANQFDYVKNFYYEQAGRDEALGGISGFQIETSGKTHKEEFIDVVNKINKRDKSGKKM